MGYDKQSGNQLRAFNKIAKYLHCISLPTGSGSSSTMIVVLWLHFISVHFLDQEYRIMSPDNLCMIEQVGSWG